ncbi:unnamed protein product, partial [Mesorhabditis belari]|uniref:Uncharacterized protein n=1 Tax=Mesorhabditis belari TaxID=2138241 RepID=A0AAF3EC34_9BILA
MLHNIFTNSLTSNFSKCSYNDTWENFLGKFVELMTGDCPTTQNITNSCICEILAIYFYRIAILFQVHKLEKRGTFEGFARVFIFSWLVADLFETFAIFFHHTLQPMRTMGACFILMDSIIVISNLYHDLSTTTKYSLFFMSFFVVFLGLPIVAVLIDVNLPGDLLDDSVSETNFWKWNTANENQVTVTPLSWQFRLP